MSEKKTRVSFTEKDAVALMQRYDPSTVFILLQEVAHYAKPKIDWSELVKKSATGISNVREYQMLWRHLAYRHSLPENFEVGAEPLDDDSDLECELEELPPVSVESASEAAACVKVMIASRTLSDSAPSSSTIEAPLTINVPVCHSSATLIESSQPSNLMQGTNIVFPVTVQRQTLPTHPVPPTDGIESKGLVGGNLASKRKRKTWSEEEDIQLRAAVQRWGEGNWATMAKGDNFPIKRSPTQLAQRWSILRKKDGTVNSGTISTSSQYTTAEQLATRHSLSLALDMPFKKLTAPGVSDPVKTSTSVKNQVQIRNTVEKVATSFVPPQQPSRQASLLGSDSHSHVKPKLVDEKLISKGNIISNPVLKSTTAAPGTRIDSPSNTISHVKIAPVKHNVDTKPAVSSLAKPSVSTNMPSDPKNKPTTSLTDKVPLEQDANSTKDDTSSRPKDQTPENEAPKVTIDSQVNSNLEKGRLDIGQAKIVPVSSGEESLKDKASPVTNEKQPSVTKANAAVSENQGTVKNATENSNLDKGNLTSNQDKKTSINESSNNQNINDKHVNLPVQDEGSQSDKVVKLMENVE
ncbi:uncharacterized protein LOC124835701 [Vigna umbellata]|uniref:uncharacterized protein LOC124835701 n=1 Tax=Vigna umbellata TaxID=87088 RepID=UPI001F5E6F58|nr:uncharacterized protein LOC124835701 [Vigna umbellata]